jgi:hypothetical protein
VLSHASLLSLEREKSAWAKYGELGSSDLKKSLFVKEISEYLMKNVQVLCHEATQTNPYFYSTLF